MKDQVSFVSIESLQQLVAPGDHIDESVAWFLFPWRRHSAVAAHYPQMQQGFPLYMVDSMARVRRPGARHSPAAFYSLQSFFYYVHKPSFNG